MLIDQTSIIHCYEKIQKKAISGCVTVFIFVAFDADSLCALKILTGLLKGDNIAYKVLPVTGFSQLEDSIDECQNSDSIQSMIFLNCGGVLDLSQKWFVTERSKVKAYVFDNHRPIHHHNITDKDNIIVIEDGTQNQSNCPQREDQLFQMGIENDDEDDLSDNYDDNQVYTEDEEDEDEMQEQDDADDDEYDDNAENKQRNQKKKSNYDEDGYDDEESEVEFGKKDKKEQKRRKRRSEKRLKEKKMQKKIKIEQHKCKYTQQQNFHYILLIQPLNDSFFIDLVIYFYLLLLIPYTEQMQTYYEGFYYGKATSILIYKICQQSNKESNDYLWYTILGATDLLIHGKITQQQYDTMYEELAIEVEKVNIQKQDQYNQDINDSTTNEMKLKKNIGFIEASNEQVVLIKMIYTSHNYQLCKYRYRIICLRNWNLYESMYYSNYFTTKLGIWNENGEKNLKKLIALLGIPLEEAKQQYKFMQTVFKDKLKDNIHSEASKFKLYNVLFNSFTRQIDEKNQVSSTDMVYSLTAILECPKQILQNIFEDPLKVNTDKSTLGDNDDAAQKVQKERDVFDRIKNFWWAYETISAKDSVLILKGIDQAIQFQKALVNEAKFAIERDLITQCSDFRFVKLNNDTYSQNQYFQHPYSLQKLALFLMDIYREKQKSTQAIKPIVLCIKNTIQQAYTIIGVVGNHYSASTKNDFAFKFQDAAKSLNLQYKQDDFETSIIEISEKDFEAFLDEITLTK